MAHHRLRENVLECRISLVGLEDSQPGVGPIQGVVDEATFRRSSWYWHVLRIRDDERVPRTAPDRFPTSASKPGERMITVAQIRMAVCCNPLPALKPREGEDHEATGLEPYEFQSAPSVEAGRKLASARLDCHPRLRPRKSPPGSGASVGPAAGMRSHLRFFWRSGFHPQFRSVESLRDREQKTKADAAKPRRIGADGQANQALCGSADPICISELSCGLIFARRIAWLCRSPLTPRLTRVSARLLFSQGAGFFQHKLSASHRIYLNRVEN